MHKFNIIRIIIDYIFPNILITIVNSNIGLKFYSFLVLKVFIKMEKIILLVVLTFGHVISDRVYESECPEVAPMQDFDMTKVRHIYLDILEFGDCI